MAPWLCSCCAPRGVRAGEVVPRSGVRSPYKTKATEDQTISLLVVCGDCAEALATMRPATPIAKGSLAMAGSGCQAKGGVGKTEGGRAESALEQGRGRWHANQEIRVQVFV